MSEPVTESAATVRVKFLRGTETANNQYTGPVGELTVDLDNWRIRIHDGFTAGGHSLSSLTDVGDVLDALNALVITDIDGIEAYANEVEVRALIDEATATLLTQVGGEKANVNGNPAEDFAAKVFNVYESIIPQNANLDIGSTTNRFRSIYVDDAHLSANTLWIGDTPIMGTEQDSIMIESDTDQSIKIRTRGIGVTSLVSARGVDIATSGMNSDIQANANGVGSRVVFGAHRSVDVTAPELRVFGDLITSDNHTVGGDLTVNGSFSVVGEMSSMEVGAIQSTDNSITLNYGEKGNGVTLGTAGIIIDRGNFASYEMVFDETDDMFKVGMSGDLQTIASQQWVLNTFSETDHTHSVATTTVSGMMSASDKVKLNGVEDGAQVNVAPTKAEIDALNINAFKVNGHDVQADVPAGAVFTDTLYDDSAIQTALGNKVDKVTGKGLSSNDFTNADHTKLDGIEDGAQVNLVHSVAAKAGNVVLDAFDVGLGSVDNTADSEKPVSSAQQAALDLKVDVSAIVDHLTSVAADVPLSAAQGKVLKDAIDSVNTLLNSDDPALDTLQEIVDFVQTNRNELENLSIAAISGLQAALDGKVNKQVGKGLSTNDFTSPLKTKLEGIEAGAQVNVSTDLALSGTGNTRSITSSTGSSVIIPVATATNAGFLSKEDKEKLNSVESGAGANLGDVFYQNHDYVELRARATTKEDVGLGNVNNTSDASKPISTAQQTALNNKVDKITGKGLSANDYTESDRTKLSGIEAGAQVNLVNSVAGKAGNVSLVKADVGLGSVDNTSDSEKPVSSAQQAALDLKVDVSAIVDGLTSTDSASVLSAAQGKVLKDAIDSVNALLNSDNPALDTLQEIVDFVQTNRDDLDNLTIAAITGLQAALDAKVDQVAGKGLSKNDFTDTLKNKLDGVQAGAQVNVATDLAFTGAGNTRSITSSTGANATLGVATTSNAGLLSIEDKLKLNGLSQYTGDVFDEDGDYPTLRARATTQSDIGLANVLNVASYSKTEVDTMNNGPLTVGPTGRIVDGTLDCGQING